MSGGIGKFRKIVKIFIYIQCLDLTMFRVRNVAPAAGAARG